MLSADIDSVGMVAIDIIAVDVALRQLGVQLITSGADITADYARKSYKSGTTYGTLTLKRIGVEAVIGDGPADWRVIDALKVRNLSALRGITDEMNKQIIKELTGGVQLGESIPKLAKRLTGRVDKIGKTRATMMARTETINAFTQGAELRYAQAGIKTLEWLTAHDDRTCQDCLELDGKRFSIKSAHVRPPLHPNCFIEGTRLELAGDIIHALRARYNGQVVELTLSDGRRLTVTPNHMLLTSCGFLAAKFIQNGDDVICRTGFEGVNLSIDPNNDNIQPTVEEVFSSFRISGSVTAIGVPASPVYLHNDGEFIQGDINIIAPDGFLLGASDSAFIEHFNKDSLGSANPLMASFSINSDLTPMLISLAHAADSSMGSIRESDPFFWGRLTHPKIHGLTPISWSDSVPLKATRDDVSGYTQLLSDLLNRHSRTIQIQNITNINIRDYHGYIYDFQTLSTLCIGNGVLTSNCRCTILPVID